MITFEKILSVALSLSPGERAMLADRLLGSLARIRSGLIHSGRRKLSEDFAIAEGKVETLDWELVIQKRRESKSRD